MVVIFVWPQIKKESSPQVVDGIVDVAFRLFDGFPAVVHLRTGESLPMNAIGAPYKRWRKQKNRKIDLPTDVIQQQSIFCPQKFSKKRDFWFTTEEAHMYTVRSRWSQRITFPMQWGVWLIDTPKTVGIYTILSKQWNPNVSDTTILSYDSFSYLTLWAPLSIDDLHMTYWNTRKKTTLMA